MRIHWLKRFTVRCFPLSENEAECRSFLWFLLLRDEVVMVKTTLRGIKLKGYRFMGNNFVFVIFLVRIMYTDFQAVIFNLYIKMLAANNY